MLYQKDELVRLAIFDSLSQQHLTQIAQLETKLRDEKEEKRRAS